eukprot:7492696-Pyramimonas_sp.AAC.1
MPTEELRRLSINSSTSRSQVPAPPLALRAPTPARAALRRPDSERKLAETAFKVKDIQVEIASYKED